MLFHPRTKKCSNKSFSSFHWGLLFIPVTLAAQIIKMNAVREWWSRWRETWSWYTLKIPVVTMIPCRKWTTLNKIRKLISPVRRMVCWGFANVQLPSLGWMYSYWESLISSVGKQFVVPSHQLSPSNPTRHLLPVFKNAHPLHIHPEDVKYSVFRNAELFSTFDESRR